MTDPRRSSYAELHAHSNFSFLDGAAHPEELVAEASRLGLCALALTDHDGLYGVVRFAEAARRVGLPTVFGAELTLGLTRRQNGRADPEGAHLVVLARDPTGYRSLSRTIAEAQLAGGAKGIPTVSLPTLAAAHDGHWLVLTGCRKGTVPTALDAAGPRAAAAALAELVAAFGRANVAVELWDHGDPFDSARNDALAALAVTGGVELVATANAHYATPAGQHLAAVVAAVRARRSLDEMDGWLPPGPGAHLRSGSEQARRFARYPGAVERAGELGRALAFDLHLVAPGLPPFPVPPGCDEMGYLRRLVAEGATTRYGSRGAETMPGAWAQLDRELSIIEALGFPGYFLVVWDIVRFCREQDIFCQGRGSAANSAVCYALGITNADAVALGLLFERFLSAERDGPPDIDVDIESGRREEVIQYVYERHGRHHAAQVANVITYQSRSAVRDAAKALGHAPGTIDAWSRQLEHRGQLADLASDVPASVLRVAAQLEGAPRHLGVHSGGMVICDRPVVEVCPVEWASAPGRTVLQWDKEDCAAVGLVKFDLLGLGMLEALHRTVDLISDYHGTAISLATIPQDPAVYERLCAADTVGVFQVESRAQMGTLPRLKPTTFYDLVVEVALIRPGPIQGGSVHPYLRRRNNEEEITYLHPLLEPCLKKTLGVPLFQEQLMQMAIDVAGFSGAEADQLRQAMGSKRSAERMEALRQRFYAGMAERHITGEVADEIFSKMAAFANFGFPESHAVSFAYLVYSSAWLKLYYPAAFCAGLLNSQPMGFWAPRTLVADARRHGVEVRRAEVNHSAAAAGLEPAGAGREPPALRLGLASVRTLGAETAERIAAGRPYRDLEDLARRAGLSRPQLEALATAGATASLDGGERRRALWAAGALAQAGGGTLPGIVVGAEAPTLPRMDRVEETVADLWATGVSVDSSLTELARGALDRLGVTTAAGLAGRADGDRVTVAGVVTHRQRPETARGITFVNLEDETGLVNVICSVGVWARHRRVAQSASALLVRGTLEVAHGVVNVMAERIEALPLAAALRARDFC
ncbi:MAG TPA: error-prone DNA polymerase [Acidimicrobiales bacterium]|nr:error-prone DNA polymerase [Acidimicrobiales bacterium]